MAFVYTRPPLTQNALSLGAVGAAVLLLLWPEFPPLWASWVAAMPAWFKFTGVVFVLHAVIFWAFVAMCAYVDRTGGPAWIARHRIQTDIKKQPPREKVVRNLAANQLFWTPLILAGIWQLLVLRGWERAATLPSPLRFLGMMAGLTVISAAWFYASHRFLHRPWWMRRVHAVHHEFRTSTALAAEYAHPVEFIIGNFGTMAVGVIILAPSLFTIYVYAALGTFTFVAHHCGFAIPWISSPVHHDWHHFRYVEAFGTFGVLDHLLGTGKEYDKLEHGQRVEK